MSRLCFHNFYPVFILYHCCLFTVFTTFYDTTPDPWMDFIAMATQGDLPDDFPRNLEMNSLF